MLTFIFFIIILHCHQQRFKKNISLSHWKTSTLNPYVNSETLSLFEDSSGKTCSGKYTLRLLHLTPPEALVRGRLLTL